MSGFKRAIGQWRCCSLAATFREFNNLLSLSLSSDSSKIPLSIDTTIGFFFIHHSASSFCSAAKGIISRVFTSRRRALYQTNSFLPFKQIRGRTQEKSCATNNQKYSNARLCDYPHIGAHCVHRSQSKPPSPPMSDACIFPPPSGGGENAREGSKRESPRRFVYRLLTASLRRGGFSISEILFGRRGDGTLPKQSRSRNGE